MNARKWICCNLFSLVIFALLFGCAFLTGKKSDETISPPQKSAEQVEELDTLPQPVGGLRAVIAAIRYPEEALKKNWEGVVMVAVLVDTMGRVEEARIARTSGHGALDDEALIVVARVRWQTGRTGGKPVSKWTTVPLEFKVE